MDNLTGLVIPAEIVTYEVVSIVRFNSGHGEDKILIFGNTGRTHTLRRVEHILMDGTIKTRPSITSQLFTIHGHFKDKVLPILFGLPLDKTQESCTKCLEGVKCLHSELQPYTIMTDFELAT